METQLTELKDSSKTNFKQVSMPIAERIENEIYISVLATMRDSTLNVQRYRTYVGCSTFLFKDKQEPAAAPSFKPIFEHSDLHANEEAFDKSTLKDVGRVVGIVKIADLIGEHVSKYEAVGHKDIGANKIEQRLKDFCQRNEALNGPALAYWTGPGLPYDANTYLLQLPSYSEPGRPDNDFFRAAAEKEIRDVRHVTPHTPPEKPSLMKGLRSKLVELTGQT